MGNKTEDINAFFLIEVLVDSLEMSEPILIYRDADVISSITDTCVNFQFLNYPPLIVCESDFLGTQARSESSYINFNSGKSCVFPVLIPKVPTLPLPFHLRVIVMKQLKEGLFPDKMYIGKTSIDMSEEFTELMRKSICYGSHTLPISKTKKGVFEIKNLTGNIVGRLSALFKLSCFGKLISTTVDKNKGIGTSKTPQQARDANQPSSNTYDNRLGLLTHSTNDMNVEENRGVNNIDNSRKRSICETREYNNYLIDRDYNYSGNCCTFPNSPVYDYSGEYGKRYKLSETSKYGREFIDILPGGPQISCSCVHPGKQSRPTTRAKRNTCACLYSFPSGIPSKYSTRPENSMIAEDLDSTNRQVVFPLSLKKPGDVITGGDKIIDSSVYYKLTSEEESNAGQLNNNATIKSEGANDADGVFLLKIGKKMDAGKKRMLELELEANKIAETKPRLADKNCQYKEDDIPGSKKKDKEDDDPKKRKGKKKK